MVRTAAQANAELFAEMQQDHTQALANLATATQADRTSVALITKTISELSSQVSLLTAKLDMDIGRPATRPRQRQTHHKIATYILAADSGLTQMGTAPPMVTRWRSPTPRIPAGSRVAIITSQIRN